MVAPDRYFSAAEKYREGRRYSRPYFPVAGNYEHHGHMGVR